MKAYSTFLNSGKVSQGFGLLIRGDKVGAPDCDSVTFSRVMTWRAYRGLPWFGWQVLIDTFNR